MQENFELGTIDSSAAYRLASQIVIPHLKLEVFPTKGAEPFSLRMVFKTPVKPGWRERVATGTMAS